MENLKNNDFLGLDIIGVTKEGRIIDGGINLIQAMPYINLAFDTLEQQIVKQASEVSIEYIKKEQQKDENSEDKEDLANEVNQILNNSKKTYPKLTDPEDCGPSRISHMDPLKQAEEIIKNKKNHKNG